MSMGSGSSVDSRGSRHQFRCHCNKVAPSRMVKVRGPNHGRHFYGCINYPETCPNFECRDHCGFMRWEDEVTDFQDLQLRVLEKDTIISELEYEKEELHQIVKKLKGRKDIVLEDEMKELKFEVERLRTEMTNYLKAFF
ncbi:DNA topoisomerase 3-alpha, partial [Bienertia sinuspersici]